MAKFDSSDPTKRYFVTHYVGTWGLGSTAAEAKSNARSAGGRGRLWRTKLLPVGATSVYVDGMGAIVWSWTDATPEADRTNACLVVAEGSEYTKRTRAKGAA